MRISKIPILVLLLGLIQAQNEMNLKIDSVLVTDSIQPGMVARFLDQKLKDRNDIGAYYKLKSISSEGLTADYDLLDHPYTIDTLIILYPEENLLLPEIEAQIFKNLVSSRPDVLFKSDLQKTGNTYSFLSTPPEYRFVRVPPDRIGAVIWIDPEFINYFSGLAGISRSESDAWNLTGELNLHLENLWQTAGSIDINWKRPDSVSQWISLGISEPHPFGWPAGLQTTYEQDLWDGAYIRTETSIHVSVRTGLIGRTSLGGRRSRVRPTVNGKARGITSNRSDYLVFSSSGDLRNHRWFSTRGYAWNVETALGTARGTSEVETGTIFIESEAFRAVSSLLTGRVGIKAEGIWRGGGKVNEGDYYHFGGANSIRGFLENQFTVPWYALTNLELHVAAGPGARVFIFRDIALSAPGDLWHKSLGIGYIQKTDTIMMKLAYGLAGGDPIRSGKIHFQFITQFK